MNKISMFVFSMAIGISAVVTRGQDSNTQPPAGGNAATMTLNNVRVQGSLDLDNGVPIRWRKPDGSGYINIFMLDENGTLRLCHDPFFWESNDQDHLTKKVIEVRNPNTGYADFRLPFTRTNNINADSKLVLRSLSLVETNDPSELNLLRTGSDDPKNKDENAPIANGAVSGLIRWMGRRTPTDNPQAYSGYIKDAEIIGRSYGTSEKDHYGAIMFQPYDARYEPQGDAGIVAMMERGVRIAQMRGSPGDGRTGSVLEVDVNDERPIILRRAQAAPGKPLTLALTTGEDGTEADETNIMGLVKAEPTRGDGNGEGEPLQGRIELQTNKGGRLETDWVLPVPAAKVSRRTAQRIPSGKQVAIEFDHVQHDTDSIRSGADAISTEAATRLTCRTAGRYAISAGVEFAANGKGSRQVIIRLNGREDVAAMRVPAVEDESTQITFSAPPIDLRPGDYVELLVRQTSGEDLEIESSGPLAPTFSITRVG